MNVGILGCGVIGSIFARHLALSHSLMLSTRRPEAVKTLAEEVRAKIADPKEVLEKSDLIILAVKPSQLESVIAETRGMWKDSHLVISVLAGVPTESLWDGLQPARILRVMVNLPMAVSEGIFGLIRSKHNREEDRASVAALLEDMGRSYVIDESEAEAFGTLTGCGPGYVMTMVEAWIEGAIYLGLKPNVARELTFQMLKGSAELGLATKQSVCDLRWSVCSPGGTTIAGVKDLEDLGVRSALMNALITSCQRAKGYNNE